MGGANNRKITRTSHTSGNLLITPLPRRSAQENLYLQRINAVIAHVRENQKDDLSLDVLARVAGFSPFHFHRIFKSITEETINEMVVRLRLERSVGMLRATPELSVTAAAFESGFKSVSVLSRLFKKQYGLNARQWDRQCPLKKGGHVVGLFQGMFEKNILTFNPGWNQDAQNLDTFTDVRELQRELKAQGVELINEANESTTGPAHMMLMDPDGNPILVDQHV